MTTSSNRAHSKCAKRFDRRKKQTGFTLVELMVSVFLMGLVLASIVPAFTFFSKSISSLGEYTVMSQESRNGLERFGRDLHAAEGLSAASKTSLTLVLPSQMGGGTVKYDYKYDDNLETQVVVREATDAAGNSTSRRILEDVSEFEFIYYNRSGLLVTEKESILMECKNVQIDATLEKLVVTKKATDYIISARFLMRNFN